MDRWTDQLTEYLDDALPRAEREALDAHLATCLECRSTLEELRRVVDRAKGLDDRPPSQDLWSGIAARIGSSSGSAVVPFDRARTAAPSRIGRRLSFSLPQALAAGIALMALSSGSGIEIGWQVPFDSSVDPVVANLRQSLANNRSKLDTATVRILEKNLAIIDSAIVEARRALEADPNNNYLNHHLADTMRRKAELLRRASALGVRT